jgi:VanZ family protein
LANNLKLHIPWVIWLCLISFLSLTPGDKLPDITFDLFRIDTVAHILMYLCLVFLMLLGFFHQSNELNRFWVVGIVVYVMLVGLLIEVAQGSMVSNRFFGWDDIVANSVGTFIGLLCYAWYKKKELNLVRFLQ